MNMRFEFAFLVLVSSVGGTLAAGCPDGVPLVNCIVDPCDVAPVCRDYPLAECRANYCGGCNAEFYVQDMKVDCDSCPDGVPLVNCLVDPCDVAPVCRAYPLAECRTNYCGGCNAEFYVEGRKVDCNTCRDGTRALRCEDPCAEKKKQIRKKQFCLPDFCGTVCTTTWEKECEDGKTPIACLNNPCATVRCASGTVCVASLCGCTAECVPSPPGISKPKKETP